MILKRTPGCPVNTSGAPVARAYHTAVWTGNEMVVWGGSSNTVYLNTGAKYNPSLNSWASFTTSGAPSHVTAIPPFGPVPNDYLGWR